MNENPDFILKSSLFLFNDQDGDKKKIMRAPCEDA